MWQIYNRQSSDCITFVVVWGAGSSTCLISQKGVAVFWKKDRGTAVDRCEKPLYALTLHHIDPHSAASAVCSGEKLNEYKSHCLWAWEQGSHRTRHDWNQGPGPGHLGFDLPCGSRCCGALTIIVRWCFNWPRPCTWADQNHMFLHECVCGLVKTVLWLKSCPWLTVHWGLVACEEHPPPPNSLGWCNITSNFEWKFSLTQGFWGDQQCSAVVRNESWGEAVCFSKDFSFTRRSSRSRRGMELIKSELQPMTWGDMPVKRC